MRKVIFCICFIFLFFDAISQSINYIPYYKTLCEARVVQYCQNNCDSALFYYTEAFKMVDYILIDDLRDFTQCAIDADRDSLVYFAMEQCNKQIIPLALIFPAADSTCEKYKKTEQWSICMAYETQNKEIYVQKFKCPYKQVLDSLAVSDQAVRNKWNWFSRTFRNSKIAKKQLREQFVTDSCNQRVLDSMIQKYGFPNERIGCFNNYLFNSGGEVFVHYDDTLFFRNVEYKALLEGKLTPDCYAMRAERIARIFGWNKLQYSYLYSSRQGEKMTSQEKEQVDRNRYEIGLPSIKDQRIIISHKYQIYKLKQKKNQE